MALNLLTTTPVCVYRLQSPQFLLANVCFALFRRSQPLLQLFIFDDTSEDEDFPSPP